MKPEDSIIVKMKHKFRIAQLLTETAVVENY